MEKRLSPTLEAAVLTALLALMSLTLFAAPRPAKGGEVIVTGRLFADGRLSDQALLVVEVDGAHCLPAKLGEGGRFQVPVPAGTEVVLRFEKPGHVAKEVVLDTRQLNGAMGSTYKPRKVTFDVVLDKEGALQGRGYTGPVGTISFAKGGGAMKVRHHKRHAPRSELATLEP